MKSLNHDWKDYGITLIEDLASQGDSVTKNLLVKSIHHGHQANQENQD
jgi:hypothetical protein